MVGKVVPLEMPKLCGDTALTNALAALSGVWMLIVSLCARKTELTTVLGAPSMIFFVLHTPVVLAGPA